MKRHRSKAVGKAGKAGHREVATPKRAGPPKAVPGRRTETAHLTRERDQALEREKATAEVLHIISSSSGDLQPVFRTMLENAVRLCEAKFGNLWISEGDTFRVVALHNAPQAYVELRQREPVVCPGPETVMGRMARTKQTSQISDVSKGAAYAAGDALSVATVDLAGARTFISVPMLRDETLVGAINIYRQEVRPFTDKQINLVQNFAAQAVIAIENARLLNELRQRTDDLTESLEQQTATSEVLSVISGSTGDLKRVFDAILANAVRICDANFGILSLQEGGGFFRGAARHNLPPAYVQCIAERSLGLGFRPHSLSTIGRAAATKQFVHSLDYAEEAPYKERDPVAVAGVEFGGVRTIVTVPMLRESAVIGVISIFRQEVRPFTEKQIALVQNFANQAVIAIENTRLLDDLNKLNRQLEQRVTDQVGEIERMGRLRRFLPPQVADLIVASGTEKQLESHRREITALFCDLRGFTGFSESSDPEDVMALLRNYHAAIGKIIIKYSGTLERYAGDGVMVVFNDPVPVENPAMQAVLMALEMRETIGALIEKWKRLGHDLGFGIGIAHGFATLGTIGFEGRFDYAAIGTVSNVASRLCDEAKSGQILISPRVLMAVEDAVTTELVGEFTLKGIRRSMAAHNVLATNLS
jgi:class 3 adenylate cyclase/putative methionine-R-sulfoxide reductase with GAF domain